MTERGDETENLFAGFEPDGSTPKRKRRRGRGWIIAAWIVGVFLVLAVIAFFVTDGLIRSSAEAIAASEIEQRLPADVNGTVHVKIEGGPVLIQYLSGSFDHIELDAPSLDANGVPVAVHVDARGVPTDLSKPVKRITGTVTLDEDAVNKALKVPNASSGVSLGQGVVTYDGSQSVLGVPITYTVTAKPSVSGPNILLTPTDVHVTSGPLNLDLTGVINGLLGKNPVPVCVADQLPSALHLTSVSVTPSNVTLALKANDVALNSATFDSKGTC
jgi:hypothetical protein